jgi:NAD(P)-dependent dehydrogenase (short-subunit alcohol dehydrogenase family)
MDAEGWRVFAGVRTENDAARLRAVLSSRSQPVLLDVTDADQIEAARQIVAERTGHRLDGLVNNAGIVFHAPVECLSVDGLRRQLEVNVVGVFAVTRAFLPLVRAARGRVIVVGSISGRVAWPLNGIYAASKHAVRGLVESLRMEQRCFGVRVILIEPGAFATAIWRKFTPPQYLELERLEPHVARRGAAAMRVIQRAMRAIARRAPPPDRCVAAVRAALTSEVPRARYTVGNDIGPQLVFARIPAAIKDPLISAAMNAILGRSDNLLERQRGDCATVRQVRCVPETAVAGPTVP